MFDPVGWVHSLWIPREEVRAEIWALGVRHNGRVIEGARLEAKAPGITVRRAVLLKAALHYCAGSDDALGDRGRRGPRR